MSKQSLEEFQHQFFQHGDWHDRLKDITDKEQFICSVVELGKEYGFDFTAEEVEEVLVEKGGIQSAHQHLNQLQFTFY
jgi:hypothetical protein